MKHSVRTLVAAILIHGIALFGIAACGGGGGGSSAAPPPTASPPPPPPPPPTGGIVRTGIAFAVGPITGFGSVIVNGISYDTSGATVLKDGSAASQDDLAVGQVIVIQGTIDDDNTNAAAETIVFEDNVEGPVQSVDDANDILIVLGQTVRLGPGTSVDDSCPAALADFLAVPAVEVSGSVRADGSIDATRVECRSALPLEFEVTGAVSNLDATASTFNINDLVVDFALASIDNFPGGSISNGDPVEAKGGTTLGPGGELVATRVEYKGARFAENEGDHAEIEGFITRFASATDFDVAGIPVTTSDETQFEGGTAADLGLNLKVEAEGEFDSAGILNATKIDIKTSTNVRVTGLIDAVEGDVVTVLGISINTDPLTTRFEDKTDADVDPLRVGNLAVNDYIEARGQELPPGEISAFIVERDDADPRTELRGFVESGGVDRPTLTVLGVTIETNSGTVFRDATGAVLGADAFWDAVSEGSLVNVDGSESAATTILAEEVELEME